MIYSRRHISVMSGDNRVQKERGKGYMVNMNGHQENHLKWCNDLFEIKGNDYKSRLPRPAINSSRQCLNLTDFLNRPRNSTGEEESAGINGD